MKVGRPVSEARDFDDRTFVLAKYGFRDSASGLVICFARDGLTKIDTADFTTGVGDPDAAENR